MKTIHFISQHIFKIGFFAGLVIIISGCGSSPPDDILAKSGQAALVFVKENSQQGNRSNPMRSNADEYYPGTDLYFLSPISIHGSTKNLTGQYTRNGQSNSRNYGAVADPEVSYDGKKVLFSMKENRQARWHIYEMNIDGTGLAQLTDQTQGDDMDPAYLPNGQIVFASTRPGIVDEYERRGSPLLHVADRTNDGRLINIRQISFNQSFDCNPIVHSSGKIFYSRWEHLGSPNKFPLFVMNPDGTRPFVLYGNHSPRQSGSRVFMEPRELSDGGIVCSVMERNSPFEGGAIAVIDISSSDDNLIFISPETVPFNNTNRESEALFKTPHPIFDESAPVDRREKIIVSVSPIAVGGEIEDEVDFGLYVMDTDGSNLRLIFNDPNYNEIDAVPVLPREDLPGGVPRVIPMDPNVENGLANGSQTGFFFDGNVYDRATNDGQPRPNVEYVNADGSLGEARYVRVLAAIGMPRDRDERGGPLGDTNFEKQRVVGYAPIRDDGSFSIEVPANVSLHVQTLNENGLMLVNQLSWIQVMPGEKRLCTGCHDSHSRDKIINDLNVMASLEVQNSASGRLFESGFHNPVNVADDQAARADTVDFYDKLRPYKTNTVQNTFDTQCISCHSNASPVGSLSLQTTAADQSGGNMDNESTVYETLTSAGYQTETGNDIDYVTRNGARRSPLLWVQFGRQLDRTDNQDYRNLSYDHTQLWQKDAYGRIDPFLPANRNLLTLIEWVDMGIQYSNTTEER
jgi:hypothetical protein